MNIRDLSPPDERQDDGIILLVEDDPDDITLIEAAIRNAGIVKPIIQIGDGEEAMKYLSASPPYEDRAVFPMPHLVLLDLKMPRRNGFDVLTWKRTQIHLKDLAVIVLTGSIDEKDKRRARELGALDFQEKPVRFSDLVQILRGLRNRWVVEFRNSFQII